MKEIIPQQPNLDKDRNSAENLEVDFGFYENKDFASLNNQVSLLLAKKFPGVEIKSTEIENIDPNYQALHHNHLDNLIVDEVAVERKLKFKDLEQKKEFYNFLKILKGGSWKEQEPLLKEIGWITAE